MAQFLTPEVLLFGLSSHCTTGGEFCRMLCGKKSPVERRSLHLTTDDGRPAFQITAYNCSFKWCFHGLLFVVGSGVIH